MKVTPTLSGEINKAITSGSLFDVLKDLDTNMELGAGDTDQQQVRERSLNLHSQTLIRKDLIPPISYGTTYPITNNSIISLVDPQSSNIDGQMPEDDGVDDLVCESDDKSVEELAIITDMEARLDAAVLAKIQECMENNTAMHDNSLHSALFFLYPPTQSKNKKRPSIKVEYIVHVQEIRPWPPSESLKSVQTVLLQWENGTQNSGSFLSVAGDSNIVFNESFILPLTLYKKVNDTFKKNYLEFSLFEPRKDKAKGQLLGTASINLSEYGVIEDILGVDAPLNFKKSSNNNTVQPALVISLELIEKESYNSSPSVGLSNEASLDNDDDDSEVASFTDDDASSHSSRTAGSYTFEAATVSPSRNDKNGYGNAGIDKDRNKNLQPSSTNAPFDTWNKVNDYVKSSKFTEQRSMSYVKKNSVTPSIRSSPSSISFRDTNGKFNNIVPRSLEDKSFERFASEAISADIGWGQFSEDATNRNFAMRSDSLVPNRKAPAVPPSSSSKARLKHVKSVQINKGNFLADIYGGGKPPDLDIPNGSQKKGKNDSDGKNEWKSRVEMLEEELREVAAIEVGLYSVVAEHANSDNKFHAPARRLSRLYSNACRAGSQAKRASAARAAVSGLVLVSKACGNDVTRLTFWLSNSIMLRAIVSQTAAELQHSNGQSKSTQEFDDCEDVLTFIMALERVESWLFHKIVESVWWQAFMPHMQPSVAKVTGGKTGSGEKKSSGRRKKLGDHELGSFSIELWKKAFKDACERLCPNRAGGHECGCLSSLVKLVMEQLVNRLDVAMFNAILRESAEDMPTDPLSDPISDSKVLPIPAGKSSFGAGAQLKNAIGIWSRWLSDLFGLGDDSPDDSVILGNGQRPNSFKAFRLLHALSDLMMLPFGMLPDASTRKEVCPTFGPTIIKRVANNFVPDEFCPYHIPRNIIDALNSEEISEAPGVLLTSFPCTVSPTKYTPPPAALLRSVGDVRSEGLKSSRLSTLKKSYTSDDELDELDSTLTSIIPDSYQNYSALAKLSLMPKKKGGRNVVRYELLRGIWRDYE
ncbi:hypothetical protein BUALT_Bualt17G0022500 [Buddleja alternifolia]|uniref:C2 NT-type domain-containing protein n=1 Tax=Buddleja alternifolia TaxID=168488 RepID=A0AAV6W5M6_9LAMI|nr:hypothetical protein BUALT_Bualt17G0022500 [Buddleja alternifolia]